MEELHHACEWIAERCHPDDTTTRGKAIVDADSLQYEKKLTDYNFGTLIRKDAHKLYDEDNAILVTRVQFFAIEVSPTSWREWVLRCLG
jgi:hypothetical protein